MMHFMGTINTSARTAGRVLDLALLANRSYPVYLLSSFLLNAIAIKPKFGNFLPLTINSQIAFTGWLRSTYIKSR
jgi:hypothetical protein